MNEPSPCQTLTALLIVAMMAGGLLLAAAPANGQVVIDMPPPPAAEREQEKEKEKETRTDADEREEARPSGDDANEADEANADADVASKAPPSSAVRIPHRHAANDVGRLALARYTGARQYARPNDPYLHWGYQPRGRGVGPWGLGHHSLWYGNVHAITPAVFIGGRGERLFR